jgi:hypothetical protein
MGGYRLPVFQPEKREISQKKTCNIYIHTYIRVYINLYIYIVGDFCWHLFKMNMSWADDERIEICQLKV